MNYITLTLSLAIALTTGCQEPTERVDSSDTTAIEVNLVIPDIVTDVTALHYDNAQSVWKKNGELYTGFMTSRHPDGSLKHQTGIYQGRKQGKSNNWFADGHLHKAAHYLTGKLHGSKKVWHSGPDHVLIAHLNYTDGKVNGEQKKWYPSGELYKVLHLNMGKEEGIQRAFRKNGELYANYEAKNGRIFGLKKAALCYGLENEVMNYGK